MTCSQPISPRDRLIVALDMPSVAAAEAMIARLGDSRDVLQDRLSARLCRRLPLVRQLADAGKKVFVDLKLHDIGNTVARGVESVAELGATFLTVHAYPQTMKAAVEARAGSDLKNSRGDRADVLRRRRSSRGRLSTRCLRSGRERARSRRRSSASMGWSARRKRRRTCARSSAHQMSLVTPGIRPAGSATGDQKRIMTPARAIAAGADYLVVGRPVMEAADPKAAADAIVAEIAASRKLKGRNWMARATGSRASTFTITMATSNTSRRTARYSRNIGGRFLVRGGKLEKQGRHVAVAQRGDRIQGLRDRAGLLQLAGIPRAGRDRAARSAKAISWSSKATTGSSPDVLGRPRD